MTRLDPTRPDPTGRDTLRMAALSWYRVSTYIYFIFVPPAILHGGRVFNSPHCSYEQWCSLYGACCSYSVREIAWHRWEQPAEAVCGAAPVAAPHSVAHTGATKRLLRAQYLRSTRRARTSLSFSERRARDLRSHFFLQQAAAATQQAAAM